MNRETKMFTGIEKIICAAIWYKNGKLYSHQPRNIPDGYVMCGMRHHNIIALNFGLTGQRTTLDASSTQGFLTNEDRFVDRIEGRKIALKSGQITNDSFSDTELYSEDMY